MYGVELQLQPLVRYDPVLARIEQLVPGQGPLADRVDAFQDRFVIPPDRLEAVMRRGDRRMPAADPGPFPAAAGAKRSRSNSSPTRAGRAIIGIRAIIAA